MMNFIVCCQNSVVADIMHLRLKKTYTKVVVICSSQGGPGPPVAKKGRTGPVQVLVLCTVQVLYSYFRSLGQVQVLYKYFRSLSSKAYIFRVEMHYIRNCRVTAK